MKRVCVVSIVLLIPFTGCGNSASEDKKNDSGGAATKKDLVGVWEAYLSRDKNGQEHDLAKTPGAIIWLLEFTSEDKYGMYTTKKPATPKLSYTFGDGKITLKPDKEVDFITSGWTLKEFTATRIILFEPIDKKEMHFKKKP